MTASVARRRPGGRSSSSPEGPASSQRHLRIAVLDRDSGFIQVLSKRLDRLGWEHRVLASPVPADAVVSMRLSALVVDLAVLGPQAWTWLERLCEALPELGIVVCTGPSTVAQRVRGLRLGADDWITKPCHPEEVIARVQSVVRRRRRVDRPDRGQPDHRRRGRDPLRPLPGVRRRREHRPDPPRVRADRAARRRRGPRARARGDLLAPVGLHDGPRRPLGRRVRAQAPPEAREGLARSWRYIHTHFGIGYRFAAESLEVVDPERRALLSSPPTGTPARAERSAIRASSRGRSRTASSPPAPSSRTTARPPFFRSIARRRSARRPRSTGPARGRPAAGGPPPPRPAIVVERLARVEAAGQRRMDAPAGRAARSSQRLRRQLGGLARAHLGAEQHRLEAQPSAPARARPRAPAARPARSERRSESSRLPCGSASA